MLVDIIEVSPLADWRLLVKFEDGVVGEINLAELVPLEGVFAPLRDPQEFCQVRVNRELGTIVWPCGADLDPDVLYTQIIKRPLPSFPSTSKT